MIRIGVIFIWVLLFSCRGTKFLRLTENETMQLGQKTTVMVDTTYELYMRQVIKKKNEDSLEVPENGLETEKKYIIEKQYLLISRKNNVAIVFNNIPSKYISFFNTSDLNSKKTISPQKEEIDIWYFNQFRFGKWNESKKTIEFDQVIKNKKCHHWIFKVAENQSLQLISILESDYMGESNSLIKPVYKIDMLFYKIPNFTIVFNENDKKKITDIPSKMTPQDSIDTYPLPGNTFYLAKHKTGWYTIFKIPELSAKEKNIVFSPKRMYAAPEKHPSIEASSDCK